MNDTMLDTLTKLPARHQLSGPGDGTAPLEAPTGHAWAGLPHPVGILGTGLDVPQRVVTNEDLTRYLDTSDEWIVTRTGIHERRYVEEGQATSDMCVAAARQALENSGVEAADVDAVIVTTFTPDQPLPSTALMVMDAIGAHRALPLDLNQAACAGGIYAMVTAAHLLQSDAFRKVLVIGGDAGSRGTDPRDRTTRVFLGDAAGAAVLGRTEAGYGILAWHTDAELSYEVEIPAGGSRRPASAESVVAGDQFLKMNGKAVWKMATGNLPASIRHTARLAGVELDDVRHLFLHQANINIINETARALGVPSERVPTTVARFGNTGAASMFTVLHESMESRVEHGDVMIMSGIGAGFLWGSLCIRHHGGPVR